MTEEAVSPVKVEKCPDEEHASTNEKQSALTNAHKKFVHPNLGSFNGSFHFTDNHHIANSQCKNHYNLDKHQQSKSLHERMLAPIASAKDVERCKALADTENLEATQPKRI